MPRRGPRGERRTADMIGAVNKTGHSQIQNGPRGAPRRPSTEAAGRSNYLAVAKAAKAQRFQCSQAEFIGVALAVASHFDDPLRDDFPD
jgi:hypothetical protein